MTGLFYQAPVRAALGLTTLLTVGQFGVLSFLGPALVGNVGFSPTQLSYVYLAGGVLTFFTSPLVGRMADRHGKWRVFSLLNLLALLALVLVTQLGRAPLLPTLGLTTVLFGVLVGRNITATILLIPVVQPGQRGAFLSLDAAVQQLAVGVATYGAGLLVANTANGSLLHYERVGYLAAATSVASFFLVRRLLVASGQRLRVAASRSAELATLRKTESPTQ